MRHEAPETSARKDRGGVNYQKTCEFCNKAFEAKRSHARYCSEPCSTQGWVEEQVYGPQRAPERVKTHALDDVRGLIEAHKGDWAAIVREHARRTLTSTGYLSAPDFEVLGVPAEHCNLVGAQIGAFAGAGYMEAISFKRWSAEAKASRKSGKYWIYRITPKGKEKLAGLSNDNKGGGDAVDNARPISSNTGTSPPGAPVVVAESGEEPPETLFGESAYEKLRDVA